MDLPEHSFCLACSAKKGKLSVIMYIPCDAGVGGWGAKDLLGGEHMVFRENGGGVGRFQQSIGRVLLKNDRRLIGQ